MKKKILIIIAIIFVVVNVIIGIFVLTPRKTTANQWVIDQNTHLETLHKMTENIDDVYTLYIIDSMSESDFLNELQILQGQYKACIIEYKQYNDEHPVETGTQTYYSEKGKDAIEALHKDYENLFNDSLTDALTPRSAEEIAYVKIAYQNEITEHLADYTAAYALIVESDDTVSVPDYSDTIQTDNNIEKK